MYRYTILLDRAPDEDFGPDQQVADHEDPDPFHDGTNAQAIAQVAKELQEAMDTTGLPVGTFNIVKREVVEV